MTALGHYAADTFNECIITFHILAQLFMIIAPAQYIFCPSSSPIILINGTTFDGFLALCTFLDSSDGIHPTSEKRPFRAKNATILALKNCLFLSLLAEKFYKIDVVPIYVCLNMSGLSKQFSQKRYTVIIAT
ncbi:hypothetical protein T4A_10215 [Trichinella pseudospiralis]|uniref:Uncharacterized protein n=1 Tax=Trichinella pseudospiralis TaxID=6337 RepID=A0A0V1EUC7_TRIPS|nr:hypothetical protein T4A_10215 [Trichinella pseudospiralis]